MRRVLFIGDGKHDVGAPEWPTDDAFPARGVVPRRAERVAAIDRERSLAMKWSHPRLARFPVGRAAKAKGYEAKLRAARLQIERGMLAVDGIVGVVDEDNDQERRGLPEVGHGLATEECPIVCGVAVRSIEAWTIGATRALAEVLGVGVEELRRACPSVHVEELYDSSGKQELRSKVAAEARGAREDERRASAARGCRAADGPGGAVQGLSGRIRAVRCAAAGGVRGGRRELT